MRTSSTSRSVVVGIVAAIVSLLCVAAVMAFGPSQGTSSGPLRADASAVIDTADAGALEDRFAVLSTPPQQESPLGAAAEHAHFADPARAVPIEAAADAPAFADDWQAWIAPGSDPGDICLLSMQPPAIGPGGGCQTLEFAAQGLLIVAAGNADEGKVEVLGVMPDGVDHVTLTMADGSSRRIPVRDNAYRADVTEATASVSFTLPGSSEPTTIDALAYSG